MTDLIIQDINTEKVKPNLRPWFIWGAVALGIIAFSWIYPTVLFNMNSNHSWKAPMALTVDSVELAKYYKQQQKDLKSLDKKITGKLPKSYYLVINSSENEFSLYKGDILVKHDKCSTGSYVLLKNGDQQQWMFKTPKGEFKIKGKTVSPVWKKPDWAFVEEGLPIPSANHPSRFEAGVLGDYSLNLGQGYLIHGTLYQRFLGLPVTHGCIRLNDENLELVFKALKTGSKVYIF